MIIIRTPRRSVPPRRRTKRRAAAPSAAVPRRAASATAFWEWADTSGRLPKIGDCAQDGAQLTDN